MTSCTMTYLQLTEKDRSAGFVRADVRMDATYGSCRVRELAVSVGLDRTVKRVTDGMADGMLASGLVTQEQHEAYLRAVKEALFDITRFDALPEEEIYAYVARLRRHMLGDAVDAYLVKKARTSPEFVSNGIDQSAKKDELIAAARALFVVITQAELLAKAKKDIERAHGAQIFVLCAGALAPLLPQGVHLLTLTEGGVSFDERLQAYVDSGDACLLFYGEEGLLACRGLALDAVVHAVPTGYCAKAITDLWQGEGCTVYVPRGMDMTANVPRKRKTKLNYRILAALWQAYGDGVYALTLDELYRRYPAYLTNVYHGGESGLPLDVRTDGAKGFDRALEEAVGRYLDGFGNVDYRVAYFDEALREQPICYDPEEQQKGILVHAVHVKRAERAEIYSCEKGRTPRHTLAYLGPRGTGIVSNFLFFMTPRLGLLYNELRRDRVHEQADAASGHLDYMRRGETETFPLFEKACLAKKKDGSFLFFNYRLGGGQVRIGDVCYRWERESVDTDTGDVRMYSPSYAACDRDADRDTYRIAVGASRVNVVLLRDKIACIRRGDVLLPSVGVVLSLTEEEARPLLEGRAPLEDGYYDVSGLSLSVRLDPPEDVSEEEWASVSFAYGGGLTLIRDGVGLCDGDHMDAWFEREGWPNPLSRQTQESNLHTLVKHPRTAIGCMEDGSLVLLVYSGRTWRSTGADYAEMISIARQLFPEVRDLMNCDGGGSSVLGLVRDGEMMELSFPSTSSGSCAGQVRPINTVFYIPVE